MKPFNLEEFLAGKPVCTTTGEEVVQLRYNKYGVPGEELSGWIDGRIKSWYENGRYTKFASDSYDLVMKPVKREGWVILYKPSISTYLAKTSYVFRNKEDAEIYSKPFQREVIGIVKVEWEE